MVLLNRRGAVEQRKKLKGQLRVLGYVCVLGVACAALSVRAARAEVADQSLAFGRQLSALTNTEVVDAQRITMNGQSMFVGSTLGKDSVPTTLDRFEEYCRRNSAQTPEEWKKLADKSPEASAEGNSFFKTGLMRSGSENEGTVLCFVRSSESKTTVGEAFSTFSDTGELGAIGQLRYAYAKKTKKGNTHVLTGWTTDKFNLKDMLPADDGKDVPGQDFAEIPRLKDAQRILATRVEGTPFGVNAYKTDAPPTEVAKFYDESLIKQGWVAVDAELDKKGEPADRAAVGHLYEKDGVVLTMAAHIDTGKTFATLGLAGVQTGPHDTSAHR
jgi:hypothetical protein